MLYLGGQRGVFLKVVLVFRNFGYDFCGVGGDVWRWLCRHVREKISALQKYEDSTPLKNGERPCTMLYLGRQRGVFSKFVLGFRNFGYDFCGVGGDVWRWLCRHVRRKISTHVHGGTSERSSVRRRWAEILINIWQLSLTPLNALQDQNIPWILVRWKVRQISAEIFTNELWMF